MTTNQTNFSMTSLKIGTPHIQLDRIDSTNSYARQLLEKQHPAEGTVITAFFQSDGRGQAFSQWESEKGKNLIASYILYPGLRIEKIFLLNKCISVAVQQAFQPLMEGVSLSIKWPNDLMADNQKLAGILIENGIKDRFVSHSIVGIGVNVSQQHFKSYVPPATSLVKLTVKPYTVEIILDLLNKSLSKWYSLMQQGLEKIIDDTYHENLFRFKTRSDFVINGTQVKGQIEGVDDTGCLKVRFKDQEVQRFQHKELKFVFT